MKTKLLLAGALLLLPLMLVACGGVSGGSKTTPDSADATYQAARDEADQTPVSDSLREYVQQMCDPIAAFVTEATETIEELAKRETAESTPADDLEAALGPLAFFFGDLEEPIRKLRDDLSNVDPPGDYREYHDAFIEQLDYTLEIVAALQEDGFGALFDTATEQPTPEEPAGFEAAMLQECDNFGDLLGEFGNDLFGLGGNGEDATATPPPPGSVGDTIRSGDFELTVNSFVNPYSSDDTSFQPTPGQRWVLVDVSIKNVSDETKDYSSFDFSLSDSDNFSYDPTYIGQSQDLSFGSLRPDETIRGTLGFELPVDSVPNRLIYDPGFFGEGRIDIDLR